jgi:hypothetical protein
VGRCLRPGGIFIFDFTTQLHSNACVEWLDKEETWIGDHIYLYRESRYDASDRRHVNTFRMFERPRNTWTPDPTEPPDIIETHVQRPYELPEMIRILRDAGVASWEAYREFDLEPADESSERVTMVCRW